MRARRVYEGLGCSGGLGGFRRHILNILCLLHDICINAFDYLHGATTTLDTLVLSILFVLLWFAGSNITIFHFKYLFQFCKNMGRTGKTSAPAEPKPLPEAKKAKLQAAAEEAEAIRLAGEKKAAQRLLAATCGKPGATAEQKAMHADYKQLDHFSKEKDILLQKFLKDKKCGWYQGLEQVKSESTAAVNTGLKGYGTRCYCQLCCFCT